MSVPENLLYTETHEWVGAIGDGIVRIGVTDHAQHEMGDIVFVEMPAIGDAITAGGRFASIESVKAVSDIFSPVSGIVTAVNDEVADDPAKLNQDAFGAWMIEAEGVDISANAKLMTAEKYKAFISEA